MMSDIKNIQNHQFTAEEKIFIDTNVWLSVFGPVPFKRKRASIYSSAWRDILVANCNVYADVVVISEFIYRYLKIERKQSPDPKNDLKSFRETDAYTAIANDIIYNTKRILRSCERINSCFKDIDIDLLLQEFGEGKIDFNDIVIEEICKRNELTLITDDRDFKDIELNILTANNRLLN